MSINKNNLNKIFVLQGPNLNLLKLQKSIHLKTEKLNQHIKKKSQEYNNNIIIFQTNEEGKAISRLQKYRKKISGVILFPGPWSKSGYPILDLLNMIKIPYVTISIINKGSIFTGIKNLEGEDLLQLTSEAFLLLNNNFNLQKNDQSK